MKTNLQFLTQWVVIVALAMMGTASAQTSGLTSYDVELIVFRTLSAKATPEDWSMEAGTHQHLVINDEDTPGAETTIAPPPPTAQTASFPSLPQAKFRLVSIADTLRRSRNYQPLAHFGWTQPGFPRGEPRYLSIDGLVPASSGLSGQIALARGRYLHLTLELTLNSAEDGGKLVLRQTRRMRSNERHYIDHPKFGVIALITPAAG